MKILKKLALIVIVITILVIGVLYVYISNKENKQNSEPLPQTGASYLKLLPGKSSKQDAIATLGTPLNDPSSTTLEFKSSNPNLPDEVTTDGQTVLFIKEIVTKEDQKTAEDIKKNFGEAPYVLYGSDSANGFNLYVYPEKGIAYIGHAKDPIVLEIWYFTPTTIGNFQKNWATNYSATYSPVQ